MDSVSILNTWASGRGIVIHNLFLNIFQLQPTFFIFGSLLVFFFCYRRKL